jgi:thioredoxin-dependent peroxiredoxin
MNIITMDMTRYTIAAVALGILLFAMSACVKQEDMLGLGSKAPDFELPDQDGKLHKLSSYLGKKVLIYFYPKDNTPGCTAEACALRDNFDQLKAKNLVIFGISADTIESHKKFANDHGLPFTLLADPEKVVVKKYNANGKLFVSRISYLIDEQGKIMKVYPSVNPINHASEIMSDLN